MTEIKSFDSPDAVEGIKDWSEVRFVLIAKSIYDSMRKDSLSLKSRLLKVHILAEKDNGEYLDI